MKLSIVMMVKNESKYLEKCLNSLLSIMKEINSELIIVDTGSEDNTVEIAKRYTDKVYFHEWNYNFSEMRNITISYAKGEWIFIIDGDEVVERPEALVKFLKSNKASNYNTGVIAIKSCLRENDDLMYGTLLIPRLFKNHKGFMYEGAIHEQPKAKPPVYNIDIQLLHYGYISTDKELMERKFHRNIQILKSELEKNPDNFYYWHQLSLSYGMHKDYKESLEAGLKAYEVIKKKKIDFKNCMYAYTHLAIAYLWNEMYKEAEAICKESLRVRDEYIDIFFVLGKSQRELGKTQDAIDSFNKYLKMHQNYNEYFGSKDLTTVNYTLGLIEEVYLNLSILYKDIEKYDKAMDYITRIRTTKILSMSLETIVDIHVKLNKYSELRRFYIKEILENNEELSNRFTIYLEKNIKHLNQNERNKLIKNFAGKNNEYSILNQVRLDSIDDNYKEEEIIEYIKKLDINILPEFYGDIIHYLIKRQINIVDIFPNLKESKISCFLLYLYEKDELSSVILKYLKQQVKSVITNQLRINKTLAKFLIIQNNLDEDEYRDVFLRYVDDGISYLNNVYNYNIIENEMVYDLKDDEDIFLLYMYVAEKVKYTDVIKYVRYLRKALKAYPIMKEGIELLLVEAKEFVEDKSNIIIKNNVIADENKQFKLYTSQVKLQIEDFINNSKLQEAKELIYEYEKIVAKDADILCMKGIISMIEKDIESAQMFFEQGLQIDNNNFDILYNLGYIHQSNAQNELAIECYKKAFQSANEENDADLVYGLLKELGIKETKDNLIAKKMCNTSIVILTYNNLQYNKICIESIRKYTQKGTYEIIVVDNNSTDGTVEWLKQQDDLKLILNDENLGFPKGCNQGIEAAELGNDILLLNNDTVVTPNWLTNLKECLYSSDDIGAVGSVTNSCSNYQTIQVDYKNLEEMISFAGRHNVSNTSLWEERLRLVGFCMLIKNEVIRKVGLLDEIFTPGNFEDDDYSFRIRKAGYRLMLCKDSFIHHFGSVSFGKVSKEYNDLLINNRKKFATKWGFDPCYIIEIKKEITELIAKSGKEDINILHIGCAGGGTLLDIKNTIPSAKLYGIEYVKEAFLDTTSYAHITLGNLEEIRTFNKNHFDYIIITQLQENEKDILDIMKAVKDYIKNDGIIYIYLTKDNKEWNKKFIKKLEEKIGNYSYKITRINDQLILYMEKTNNEKINNTLELVSYKKEDLDKLYDEDIKNNGITITNLIRRLDNDIDFKMNIEKLRCLAIENDLDVEEVKAIILKHGIDKIKLFNIIGIVYHQLNASNNALMFLEEAFKLDTENSDTIYNIASILHQTNENNLALDFLNGLNNIEKDIEIQQLKQQIEEAI